MIHIDLQEKASFDLFTVGATPRTDSVFIQERYPRN